MALTKIGTLGIADDAITSALLPDNSVDSTEIVAGAVDLAHMSVNSIDSDQYVDGSIDTVHIANNAVTGAKIALGSDAEGDIMYYNGTDWVRLPKGSGSQTLKMNSGATAPEWVTV